MRNRLLSACFRAAAIVLAVGISALADPVVTYTATPLAGGFFQYDMTVNNTGGSEPLEGLIVLFGASVFDLDSSSTIGTPAGWSDEPPLVDPLFYSSGSPGTDIPIGGSLSGFSFQSDTNPSTLEPGNFAVAGVGSNDSNEILLGDAQHVPEADATFAQFALAVGLSLLIRHAQRSRRNVPRT
jgi:hypothetical protein